MCSPHTGGSAHRKLQLSPLGKKSLKIEAEELANRKSFHFAERTAWTIRNPCGTGTARPICQGTSLPPQQNRHGYNNFRQGHDERYPNRATWYAEHDENQRFRSKRNRPHGRPGRPRNRPRLHHGVYPALILPGRYHDILSQQCIGGLPHLASRLIFWRLAPFLRAKYHCVCGGCQTSAYWKGEWRSGFHKTPRMDPALVFQP